MEIAEKLIICRGANSRDPERLKICVAILSLFRLEQEVVDCNNNMLPVTVHAKRDLCINAKLLLLKERARRCALPG